MTLETDHPTPSNDVDRPEPLLASGTPDEWRLGEYAQIVVETEEVPW